jgi:membrane-bound lytic murein transglycosylase D
MINNFQSLCICGTVSVLTVLFCCGTPQVSADELDEAAVSAAYRVVQVKRDKTSISDVISPNEDDTIPKNLPESEDVVSENVAITLKTNDELIKSELKRLMSEFGEEDDLPQVYFEEVGNWIRLFQTNEQYRKFITASLKRSAKYMSPVKEVLGKKGIPEDMAYMAFIESGFNPRALSHAGAAGIWQFIPGTARNYALKVEKNIDERLDPARSTYAAADYFRDLLAIFGPKSYLLAMAAYNGGENKIISCLKRIENPFEERNFWHIRPCLSKETREYPPKIIAASIIGNNPEAFGFPKYEDIQEDFKISDLEPLRSMVVRTALRKVTPTRIDRETLVKDKKELKVKRLEPITYTVAKGNRLDMIADAFGVEAAEIKRWNKIKNDKLIAGMKLTIFPKTAMEKVTYRVQKGDTIAVISQGLKVRSSQIILCNNLKNGLQIKTGQTLAFYKKVEEKPVIHVVKKGATLAHISNKYGVRVKEIMMWNNLDTSTVFAGQKLKIYTQNSLKV